MNALLIEMAASIEELRHLITLPIEQSCDRHLLRRNIITTALHGAGIYQFDLTVSGWFGRPGMS